MTTITIPLDDRLNSFIEKEVSSGRAANKASFVRAALRALQEEREVEEILLAQRESNAGKILYGDIKTLAKKFKEK